MYTSQQLKTKQRLDASDNDILSNGPSSEMVTGQS